LRALGDHRAPHALGARHGPPPAPPRAPHRRFHMTVRLFDSYQKRKVELVPVVPGKVGIYLCGPTVQAAPHVGHARSAIAFDVARRYLTWAGYEVKYVRNITDIDDKIIKKAAERGVPTDIHAREFADEYQAQMLGVGNLPPDVEPRVTETIPLIV